MNFIKLRISGSNLPYEEIKAKLKIKAKFNYNKSANCMIYEKEYDESVSVDNLVGEFVDEFYKERDFLSSLSSSCEMTLWLSLYPDTEQAQIGISNVNLQKIADCGLNLHTTVMFLEKFYNGEYKDE